MFADPLSITYNSVSKSLKRVNQDSNGSDYYLDDGTEKFSLSIRHTIPPRGGAGESHMIRLDVDHFDATTGEYLRRTSSWNVIKTFDAVQVSADSENTTLALAAMLDATNVGKLAGREN